MSNKLLSRNYESEVRYNAKRHSRWAVHISKNDVVRGSRTAILIGHSIGIACLDVLCGKIEHVSKSEESCGMF